MAEEHVTPPLFSDPNHEQFMKETLTILIFYYGGPNDNLIKETLEPFLMPGQSIDDVRKWAKSYVKEARDHTLGYFMQTMPAFLATFKTEELWKALSEQQRGWAVSAMYYQASFSISRLAFQHESRAVDFGSIYYSGDPSMLRWKKMIRIKFVNLALKTYDTMMANDNLAELENF